MFKPQYWVTTTAVATLLVFGPELTKLEAATILTIDQQNLVAGHTNSPVWLGAGQSFIPTLNRIDAAEFSFSTPGATLQLHLYEGSGIGGPLLASSAAMPVVTVGFQFVHFDLFFPIALTPGDTYTLFVQSISGGFAQEFSGSNPYVGGVAFDEGGSPFSTTDLVFREGLHSAIPEPSTLLLLGTGLAAAGMRRRMKKRG